MLIDMMGSKPRRVYHSGIHGRRWEIRGNRRRALHWLIQQNHLKYMDHVSVSALCDFVNTVERVISLHGDTSLEIHHSGAQTRDHVYAYVWKQWIDVKTRRHWRIPDKVPKFWWFCAVEGVDLYRLPDQPFGHMIYEALSGWKPSFFSWTTRAGDGWTGTKIVVQTPLNKDISIYDRKLFNVMRRRQR